MQGKTIVVYSKKMANYLICKGNILLGTNINDKCPQYYVYLFTNNEKVLNDMNDFKK